MTATLDIASGGHPWHLSNLIAEPELLPSGEDHLGLWERPLSHGLSSKMGQSDRSAPLGGPLLSGISVQDLKKMTAMRMAQRQEGAWLSQPAPFVSRPAGSTASVPPFAAAAIPTHVQSRVQVPPPAFATPAVIMVPVAPKEPRHERSGSGHILSGGDGGNPGGSGGGGGIAPMPHGLTVQELKELTKIRLAREANSTYHGTLSTNGGSAAPSGATSPERGDRYSGVGRRTDRSRSPPPRSGLPGARGRLDTRGSERERSVGRSGSRSPIGLGMADSDTGLHGRHNRHPSNVSAVSYEGGGGGGAMYYQPATGSSPNAQQAAAAAALRRGSASRLRSNLGRAPMASESSRPGPAPAPHHRGLPPGLAAHYPTEPFLDAAGDAYGAEEFGNDGYGSEMYGNGGGGGGYSNGDGYGVHSRHREHHHQQQQHHHLQQQQHRGSPPLGPSAGIAGAAAAASMRERRARPILSLDQSVLTSQGGASAAASAAPTAVRPPMPTAMAMMPEGLMSARRPTRASSLSGAAMAMAAGEPLSPAKLLGRTSSQSGIGLVRRASVSSLASDFEEDISYKVAEYVLLTPKTPGTPMRFRDQAWLGQVQSSALMPDVAALMAGPGSGAGGPEAFGLGPGQSRYGERRSSGSNLVGSSGLATPSHLRRSGSSSGIGIGGRSGSVSGPMGGASKASGVSMASPTIRRFGFGVSGAGVGGGGGVERSGLGLDGLDDPSSGSAATAGVPGGIFFGIEGELDVDSGGLFMGPGQGYDLDLMSPAARRLREVAQAYQSGRLGKEERANAKRQILLGMAAGASSESSLAGGAGNGMDGRGEAGKAGVGSYLGVAAGDYDDGGGGGGSFGGSFDLGGYYGIGNGGSSGGIAGYEDGGGVGGGGGGAGGGSGGGYLQAARSAPQFPRRSAATGRAGLVDVF